MPSPYVYALSDPLNRVDPLGLTAVDDRVFSRIRAAAVPAIPVVLGAGGAAVSLPAIVAALGSAVALALLCRFGKKVFRVTIEYRGTYTPDQKRSLPKVGGVYFMTLIRNRAYVGQSNDVKRRFYEHLRKFKYDSPGDIRSISVFHVAVSGSATRRCAASLSAPCTAR